MKKPTDESSRTITLLSGSPKPVVKPSVSRFLCDLAETQFSSEGLRVYKVDAQSSLVNGSVEEAYRTILRSDALLIAFPLYFFCLPGMLTRFLQDFAVYACNHENESRLRSVYAVVNCGFPESDINEESVRVTARFAAAVHARFRFGILIGGGGIVLSAPKAPFMKSFFWKIRDAFDQIQKDALACADEPHANVYVEVKFPRKLYFRMGDFGWRYAAKKNGLSRKDILRRPYAPK
jgi:multimeric flavodoxin WrbA